ncbi:lysoplasmalogenase-like protein TMEM86A isoform X1 [Centruroides sculpturatus]|uniref:lysoplasmalogenase-like protein TMEM86A isoform X1 n=1 Tax=Centruroides sculpturatus TaxID=218467 RepID=UPI000C6D706E|nr:lysoplasmalogenase-like protein TMEM86A isoform X1 [Centruroides sculpturatus]
MCHSRTRDTPSKWDYLGKERKTQRPQPPQNFQYRGNLLKSVGPKLVPFFKTVAVYFVLAIPGDNPSWFACLIKCLPVGWLCIFVILHGMSLDEKHTYSRRILTGLIFSCFGDLLLIWPCYFIWGMLSFAIAHVLYILAFGMSPLNPIAGLVCISLGTTATYIMYPGMSGNYNL